MQLKMHRALKSYFNPVPPVHVGKKDAVVVVVLVVVSCDRLDIGFALNLKAVFRLLFVSVVCIIIWLKDK